MDTRNHKGLTQILPVCFIKKRLSYIFVTHLRDTQNNSNFIAAVKFRNILVLNLFNILSKVKFE